MRKKWNYFEEDEGRSVEEGVRSRFLVLSVGWGLGRCFRVGKYNKVSVFFYYGVSF